MGIDGRESVLGFLGELRGLGAVTCFAFWVGSTRIESTRQKQ